MKQHYGRAQEAVYNAAWHVVPLTSLSGARFTPSGAPKEQSWKARNVMVGRMYPRLDLGVTTRIPSSLSYSNGDQSIPHLVNDISGSS